VNLFRKIIDRLGETITKNAVDHTRSLTGQVTPQRPARISPPEVVGGGIQVYEGDGVQDVTAIPYIEQRPPAPSPKPPPRPQPPTNVRYP
jgi:hypothetical protein